MIAMREMTASDRPACAAIFEAAWNETFPTMARRIGVAEFATETSDEGVFVAAVDGNVCGFASLYAPDSFLHHLYVAPGAYRRGIGSALLHEAIRRADARLSLKCQLDNERALKFYAQHRFAEGERGADERGAWVLLHAPHTP